MQYKEILSYFETDEGITKLLEVLTENFFNPIDDYSAQLIQDVVKSKEELREAKTRLAGMIGMLNVIYSKALSLKKQKEYRYYVQKKEECEKNGTKFVDGATEKESKDYVRNYRDVRDLLFGYIKSAESSLFDCKDNLERLDREMPEK